MRAFTRSLLLPMLFMLVSVFCGDVILVPRGEFLHDRNQHPFISRLHSISLLFLPHHCHSCLLSSAQHCSLVFTYSLIQSNKLQLNCLQPLCFFFYITPFLPPLMPLLTCGLRMTFVERKKIKCSSKNWKDINHFVVGREELFPGPTTAKMVDL